MKLDRTDIENFEVQKAPSNLRAPLPVTFEETGRLTSIELAEIAGKRHDNVLRDVDVMASSLTDEMLQELGVEHTTYTDAQGKERPMLILTEEATLWALSNWDHVLRARMVILFCEYHRRELARKQKALEVHRNRADGVEDVLLTLSTFDKHSANRGNQVLRAKQHEIRERRRWAEDGC